MTQFFTRIFLLLAASLGILAAPTFAQTVSIHPGLSGCTGAAVLAIPAGGGTANFHVCVNAPVTKTCGVGYKITASTSNGMTVARTLGTTYSDPIVSAGTFGNGTNNALTPTSGQAGSLIADSSTFVPAGTGILAASFVLTVPAGVAAGTYTVGPSSAIINITTSNSCADAGAGDFTPPVVVPLNVVKAAPAATPSTAVFSITPSVSVVEAGATANAVVTCNGVFASTTVAPVTVAFSTTNSTGNFTTSASPVSFTACGGQTQNIVVTPRVNTPGVQPTTVGTIVLGAIVTDTGSTISSTAGSSNVTVTDNAVAPTVSVAAAPTALSNNTGGSSTVTFTSTTAPTAPLTVTFTSPVANPSQYTTTCTGTVVITAPATTATCTITAVTPATSNASSTATVTITGGSAATYSIAAAPNNTASIVVTSAVPTVTVSTSATSLTNAAGNVATVTFTASSAAPAGGLSVPFTAPTPSGFYSTTCGSPILIAAGATTATCTITAAVTAPAGGGTATAMVTLLAGSGLIVGTPSAISVLVGFVPPAPLVAVPTMSPIALGLMALMVFGFAAFSQRRRTNK